MSKRALIIAATLLLWLGAMGWLVFFEAYPELRHQTATGYQTLLSHGVMIMDRWMTLSFQGRPIGYTHTSVDVDEQNGRTQYRINNRTILTLSIMGSRQRVAVNADAVVDALYRLISFSFDLTSTGYAISVDGTKKHDNVFDITIKGVGSSQHFTVTIPENAVIYSPMTEMALKSLNPGGRAILQIFNPVTLSSQTVTVRALRREPLHHAGTTINTTVLTATVDGMETLSWIDRDGLVVRQETSLGWTLERCAAQEALAAGARQGSEDMLTTLAVPITGDRALLNSATAVTLRLTGPTFTPEALQSQRQTVISLHSNVTDVLVRSDALPVGGCNKMATPPALTPWLASTPFVQANDQRLINKAREITGAWTNSLDAALAIYQWVFTQVAKKPTVSLPSALDVLARPEGDCNEHTYLFAGLARAAGLPCKIRVGLTLHEGQFYYHAWPSVYVGQWLDMDPTRGLPAVNTGYLSLLEGELAEQMKLMSIVGKLKVEIIGTGSRIQDSGSRMNTTGR
jgi:hypothetical protein